MSIFTRTCDFLTWLLPATNHFPRAHPHTFRRLLDAGPHVMDQLCLRFGGFYRYAKILEASAAGIAKSGCLSNP